MNTGNVLIIGEPDGGKPANVTSQLVGGGRRLADTMGGRLGLFLPCRPDDNGLLPGGVDLVYVPESPLPPDNARALLPSVLALVREEKPDLLLLPHTPTGRDLAAQLACRLQTGLAPGCTRLRFNEDRGQVEMNRPVHGGKALEVSVSLSTPAIATIQAGSMPAAASSGRVPAIRMIPVAGPPPAGPKVVKTTPDPASGPRLDQAPIVVCGGRGIGGPEGYAAIEKLARVLDGAAGASRPVCDHGWARPTAQIGITGKTVRPELYLALGVSGSTQHLAGCLGARTILAINRDPEAPIFRYARYGLVADVHEILPGLTAALEKRLAPPPSDET